MWGKIRNYVLVLFCLYIIYFLTTFKQNMQPKIKKQQIVEKLTEEQQIEKKHNEIKNKLFLDNWLSNQERRKALVEDTCRKKEELAFGVPSVPLQNFIIEPHNQLVYCLQPKAGTTTMFNVILDNASLTPEESKMKLFNIHRKVHKLFRAKSLEEIKVSLERSVSFTVVRHPFERLVSAYKDKIGTFWKSDYEMKRRDILNKYGSLKFSSFVDYVLDLAEQTCRSPGDCTMDGHWAPLVSRCYFCQIRYTAILSMETFDDDLRAMSLITKIPFTQKLNTEDRNKSKGNTSQSVSEYLKQLNTTQLDGLKRLYADDFQMFGYDIEQFN